MDGIINEPDFNQPDEITTLRARVAELEKECDSAREEVEGAAVLNGKMFDSLIAKDKQIAAQQLVIQQMREALQILDHASNVSCGKAQEALALQSSTEQLDVYVAEKVKEEREAKESAQNVVCFYEQLCSPFYQIIPMEDQIKLRDLGYEIKYLPIYADQPDPTYITDWVFEVRDKHGSSVCKAHKWLYSAIKAAIRARSDKENWDA